MVDEVCCQPQEVIEYHSITPRYRRFVLGRPRVALLDRDKLGTAALKLVDRDGDFTMPGLAKHLGVQVSSIYHHVPGGRSEVVELVRVLVTNRIDGSAFNTLPWDEAFVVWAHSYLEAF